MSGLASLPPEYTGDRQLGIAIDRTDLRRAGIERADAFVALTGSDNANIVAARVARDTFRVRNVVARIRNPTKAKLFTRLGVKTVTSVEWLVDQIAGSIGGDTLDTVWEDPTGTTVLLSRTLPPEWAGRRLAGMNVPGRFEIVSVTRSGENRIFDDEMLGQEEDVVYFLAHKKHRSDIGRRLAHPEDYA